MKKVCRATAAVLVLLMVLSIGGMFVSAAGTVTSFSDVKKTHWAYDTIMSMTRKGLFKGMTEPVNGVSEFWPDRTMSRAEFVTVSLRAIYPSEAKKIKNQEGDWWKGYYDLALEKGILLPTELGKGALNQPMTRQEMAMVMVRCVEKNGETVDNLVSTDRIADYSTISKTYQSYVRKCFSFGLICGIDDQGTFAPTMSLTRAQAATVLCRLVDQSVRVDVNGDGTDIGNNGQYEDESVEMPWDNGGKQPSQYTWAEFEALTPAQQEAFFEWFGSVDEFEKWQEHAMGAHNSEEMPWENGGKKPDSYTWTEFEALSVIQKEKFVEWFDSAEDFEDWQEKALKANGEQLPWENGGKKPSAYTWAEFEALSTIQQEKFIEWFATAEAFEAWMEKAQGA